MHAFGVGLLIQTKKTRNVKQGGFRSELFKRVFFDLGFTLSNERDQVDLAQ